MNTSSYRAGIIGLGFIGAADQTSGDALGQRVENLDGTHLVALTRNPRIQLVAGSSRDDGRQSRFAERTGVRTYSDWREMIAKEALDLVSVATYTPVHKEVTVACARSGIRAIYCEKPMAPRIADGEAMLRACRESGALLILNHNRRFHPNYRRLRDLLAEGGLGQLTSVNWRVRDRDRLGQLGRVRLTWFPAVRVPQALGALASRAPGVRMPWDRLECSRCCRARSIGERARVLPTPTTACFGPELVGLVLVALLRCRFRRSRCRLQVGPWLVPAAACRCRHRGCGCEKHGRWPDYGRIADGLSRRWRACRESGALYDLSTVHNRSDFIRIIAVCGICSPRVGWVS